MKLNGVDFETYEKNYPDKNGYYGHFGGSYLPKELEEAFAEVRKAYAKLKNDPSFKAELLRIRRDFQGRPTPLYEAKRLSEKYGKLRIFLKREDLNHTGAHKINHTMAEALLAKAMGKTKLIAETGAGQHGLGRCHSGGPFWL
jgi:tryptophan synthase beta chain